MLRHLIALVALLLVGCAADKTESTTSQNWPADIRPAQVQGMWLAPSGSDHEFQLLWLKPDSSWVRAVAHGKFANLSSLEYVERGERWELNHPAGQQEMQPTIFAGEQNYPVAKLSRGEMHVGPWMSSITFTQRYIRAWPSVETRVTNLLAAYDKALAEGRDPTQAQIESDNPGSKPRVTVSGDSDTGVGVSIDFGAAEGPSEAEQNPN